MSSTSLVPGSPTASLVTSRPTSSGSSESSSDFPPASPAEHPEFTTNSNGDVYTNTTIDDFSPLVTFSNAASDWVTPLTDSNLSAVRPAEPRTWNLGTYRRTEVRNASVTIEFWGSELHLYGDTGPTYGAYALSVDGEDPTIHSAFARDRGKGPSHLLHSLRDLSEGRHEVVITALGTREGLSEGESLLFDYAVARQRVAEPGTVQALASLDIRGEALSSVTKNGTWAVERVQDDLQPGEGGIKPAIYFERVAYATTESWATLTHTFRGSGIQVYGGRNATHGSYSVTLSNAGTSNVVHSQVYNATADCDFPEPEASDTKPSCEWRGSVLKFAAADLDPTLEWRLQLQNIGQTGRSTFEVNLIRVIGPGSELNTVDGGAVFVNGSAVPSTGEEADDTGAGYVNSPNILVNVLILLLFLRAFVTAFRH
ncbi:hypothetical protein BKA70DRAFT_1266755 [Coprinopsis sp. MPI-PUGE-AT-0042]|nr:hypothetical protein BKA70DRAFT_1266755 [Coprinopsis sp. MPI-PUGE-AT-0042]